MAYARGRTLASHGQMFGPMLVDSGSASASADESVRLTQLVVAIIQRRTLPTPAPVDPPDGDGELIPGTDPDPGLDLCPAEVPVAYVDVTPPGQTPPAVTYRFSSVPINKTELPDRPWVTRFGSVRRALTNRRGDIRGSVFEIELDDTTRLLRGLEDTDALINSEIAAYIDTEENLNAVAPEDPRRVFAGYVIDTDPVGGLSFRLRASDIFQALLDRKPKGSQEFQRYPQRVFTLDDFPNMANNPNDLVSPGNPAMLGKPVPVGYGKLSDEEAGIDAVGVVPGIFVGTRFNEAMNMDLDEYVFFGHAPGQFPSVFAPAGPGLSTGPDYASRIKFTTGDGNGVDFIWFGSAEWTAMHGTNRYVDINGNRYTMAYGRGPRSHLLARTGKVPLLANLWGVEDVGDGTGDVITSLARQVAHFVINFVLRNYTTGNWTAPTLMNGYSQFKTVTAETCRDVSIDRIGDTGYQGAWLAGWDARGWTLSDFIRIAHDHALDFGNNRDGQIILSMVNTAQAINRSISDVTDTLRQSFRARRLREEVATKYVYFYARRYSPPLPSQTPVEGSPLPPGTRLEQTDWVFEPDPVVEDDTKYGTRPMTLHLELTRDTVTADDIVAYHNEIRTPGPMAPSFDELLCGLNTELGDVDALTHLEGVTATGYEDRPLRCEAHELDLQAFTVEKEYLDLDNVG